MEIFCFFIGIWYEYTLNTFLLLTALALVFITPGYTIILAFFCGLFVYSFHTYFTLPHGFPNKTPASQVTLKGTIVSIPVKTPYKTQFTIAVDALNNKPARGLIQLSWYSKTPPLKMGQRWQFMAKIKKPHNFLNPGSFNYVTSLLAKHIYWTGTINSKNNQLIHTPNSFLNGLSLREQLAHRLTDLAPSQQIAGIIEALTLNLTSQISQEDWDLFRRTGTTHLFGISGEHIALVSGLITWIIKKLWSFSIRCCLWMPAISVASVGGLIAAFCYSLLAGFAPPVQRALIGCLFYTLYCLGKRRFSPWQVWRYALFAVLVFEPHVIFMQGFYFSFLAVACLFLTQERFQLKGYKASLALQCSCLVGLMPLTLYWFSYGSINGFLANLFAIPLVGLCIVPLALLTLMFNSFNWVWLFIKPLSTLINLLLKGLVYIQHLEAVNLVASINQVMYVCSLIGALLLLILLPVKPFKTLAGLWLIVPFFPAHRFIAPGEALIHVLDVGQGLAVSIQTQNHSLLYDTGDQFFQGSDLGDMVILPFYRTLGLKKIDKIVISHPDKDHRGGLKSVEKGIQVEELLVNDLSYYDHGSNCHDYPQWQWDGVLFRFIPVNEFFTDKNNNSCVLQISTATSKILLPGDIEKEGEDYLVRTYGSQLTSDVLIVPHHGSKTSSTYRFLLEVNPHYAIASLGLDNRFHFPHAKIINNLRSLQIPFIRTDECGMVTFILPAVGTMKAPQCYAIS